MDHSSAYAGKRILIADDSQVARTVLVKRLKSMGFEVTVVENGRDAWNVLSREDSPDIALLDWIMPDIEGIEICRRLRAEERDRYIYIIMVTTKGDISDMTLALDAGADDFIVKPFDPLELDARVRTGIRILDYASRLRAANQELRQIATHDSLTLCLNRGAIVDRLDQELNRVRRDNKPLSLIIADLDRFTEFNTRFGEEAGNDSLASVARALKASCRIYDVVGRYAGDQFLIVLPNANHDAAAMVASRMREGIAEAGSTVDSAAITASVGVATWHPENAVTPQVIVRAAENATAKSRELGGNVCTVATQEDFVAIMG